MKPNFLKERIPIEQNQLNRLPNRHPPENDYALPQNTDRSWRGTEPSSSAPAQGTKPGSEAQPQKILAPFSQNSLDRPSASRFDKRDNSG